MTMLLDAPVVTNPTTTDDPVETLLRDRMSLSHDDHARRFDLLTDYERSAYQRLVRQNRCQSETAFDKGTRLLSAMIDVACDFAYRLAADHAVEIEPDGTTGAMAMDDLQGIAWNLAQLHSIACAPVVGAYEKDGDTWGDDLRALAGLSDQYDAAYDLELAAAEKDVLLTVHVDDAADESLVDTHIEITPLVIAEEAEHLPTLSAIPCPHCEEEQYVLSDGSTICPDCRSKPRPIQTPADRSRQMIGWLVASLQTSARVAGQWLKEHPTACTCQHCHEANADEIRHDLAALQWVARSFTPDQLFGGGGSIPRSKSLTVTVQSLAAWMGRLEAAQ